MPVELIVEPFIVLHRPIVPVREPDTYDHESDTDPRDPCVWLHEGPLGRSYTRYVRFYAADICEMLKLMAEMYLVDSEMFERNGPLTLTIGRSHSLSFKGESWLGKRGADKIHWDITLSYAWNTLPHLKILEAIRRMQTDMPAESVQVWPEGRALKGEFKQYIDRIMLKDVGAINCNPISIIREVTP